MSRFFWKSREIAASSSLRYSFTILFGKIFTMYLNEKLNLMPNKVRKILTFSFVVGISYHMCYFGLLSFDEFFLEDKDSACCLLKTKWKFATMDQLIFISHLVFRKQRAEFFFSERIRQKSKCVITQVWQYPKYL